MKYHCKDCKKKFDKLNTSQNIIVGSNRHNAPDLYMTDGVKERCSYCGSENWKYNETPNQKTKTR